MPLDRILRDRRATRFLAPWTRRENGQQWVTRILREQGAGKRVAFAVDLHIPPETIGQINLFNWSHSEHTADVGFWLRRKYWGRGFGTEALRLICQYGFGPLSLHRIGALVIDGNIGSMRSLRKVGFRREGRSRESALISGRWVDTWGFGLLRDELRDSPAR